MIPFNKPCLTGKETDYINEAVNSGKISGNGLFTQKCQSFFEKKYGFKKCLLTTSCTDALEMAAILCDIKPGDEVIIPSYTFVSTALAFIRQGAKIIFADSYESHPNIDASKIEKLISKKTKAIVPVHYAGVSCDMEMITTIAQKYNLYVIEDAAQAIDSFYKNRPLGSFGHLSTFSFHETKNIISGEGGMLVINDKSLIKRAEIIWEKGTNRAEFFRGEVNKYGWIDTGSSFLPSEIISAFLWAQIEKLDDLQNKRKRVYNQYSEALEKCNSALFHTPSIPEYATNNAHMYYLIFKNQESRASFISFLKKHQILSVFHYISLHKSPYYKDLYTGDELSNSDRFSDCLVRLPMYADLEENEVEYIIKVIKKYIESNESSF